MSDRTILVATSSVLGEYDGRPLYIHKGVTTVRDGHPLLDTFGDHFGPLQPMFEWTEADEAARNQEPEDEDPAAAEDEEDQEPDPGPGGHADAETAAGTPSAPAAKDVRAWAADQGIEVSPKGKIPAEVIEQYQAAHSEA